MSEPYDKDGLPHKADGPWQIPPLVWYIHGHNISKEVNDWMAENNITYPWDAETQMLFDLRFVHVDRGSPPPSPRLSANILQKIKLRTQSRNGI